MITIRVHGTPAPQGSKARGRNGGLYEVSKRVRPWREAVASAVAQDRLRILRTSFDHGMISDGPVAVTIIFLMARPAMHLAKSGQPKPDAPTLPAKRPDLDKLARSTLDGLKMGGAYADDGQVCQLTASKVYADAGEEPGARITIQPCDTADSPKRKDSR